MKQHRLKKKALAVSIACALALTWTPDYGSSVYAAEAGGEHSQETKETVNADSKAEQEYSLESITVEAKRPDWESKLSPGTVTIIRPDDYKGEQKTLPELLKDVPGVHVRYVSGKGQYTTVTVRGSTAAQVGVFVDGVLSNLGGDAAVDISTIPINNVERIEVYRGYIPARFGGTYMGGVINIVTKRPDKANISASVGKSSWGGQTLGVEVTQPLARGSLMIGINRDESDGDFRYTNPGSDAAYEKWMPEAQEQLANQIITLNSSLSKMDIHFATAEEAVAAFNTPAMYDTLQNTYIEKYWNKFPPFFGYISKEDAISKRFGGSEEAYNQEAKATLNNSKDSFINSTKYWINRKNQLSEDATRWRQNNDYKNTDAIIKWQDDHWLVKGGWKKIDRGLAKQLELTGDILDPTYVSVDLPGSFQRKRQELTTKDLLVGRRDTAGNLEWGWQLNYLDQDKRYRNPDSYYDNVFDKWSAYDSRRLGGAIDGSYKAGNNHMLEFMTNWSQEKMDINGNRMDKKDFEDGITNGERFRTYYEHTLFNLQFQDTITLNHAADLWLTPSVRYNYSKVMGRSIRQSNLSWMKPEDIQVNDKVTWQMALKKQVDDKLTLRSTYGTYYRLLNLYEIAGDGAGIIPRPNDPARYPGQSLFPVPEEGTQWDLSAIWDGKLLGADSSKVQLTYFGRDSKNILQLYRFGYNFWSYTNATKGRANGVELQGNFSWDKWDMTLAGTYMHTKQWSKNDSGTGTGETYYSMPHLYAPDWEGSVRLTYRSDNRLAIFSELKYIDKMYCWQQDPKKVQSSLTTIGLGAKYKIDKDLQIIAGVNDLFDKGPEMTFTSTGNSSNPLGDKQNKLIEYPLQGRTYYVTLQYKY